MRQPFPCGASTRSMVELFLLWTTSDRYELFGRRGDAINLRSETSIVCGDLMKENAALRAIQRRWWIVVFFAVLGAVVGALPEPEKVEEQVRTFTATHTLLLNDTSDQSGTSVVSPNQVTLFVGTGEVPLRAAETLGFEGNPATLASQVKSEFDFSNGALTITANGTDADRVVLVTDTFADGLVSYLAERQDVTYQERLAASIERLSELEIQLTDLTRELARDEDDPVLKAQQSAISRQYSVAFEQSDELATSPPVIGFTTLERAQAVETTDRGLGAPKSRASRAMLGAIVGATLGLGLAMLLGLADRRIRSKEQAEDALGLRAQVLIPKVRTKDRDQLIIDPRRHDGLSDAYRTVRNVVTFTHGPKQEDERAPVTLVVSPSAGDGKTSMSANLAAALAEAGKRTVLINADFRRPRLSTVFGPEAEAPLPFMLEDVESLGGPMLLNRTGVSHLRVLDLSRVDAPAGKLVRVTADKLDEISRMCDHIVIDTSPIGATAEVLDLVPYADAIVMTVRVGNSTVSRAQRAAALLRELTSVPMILAVGGLKSEKSEYDEYSDDRLAVVNKPRRRWSRPSATSEADGSAKDPTGEQEMQLDFDSVE